VLSNLLCDEPPPPPPGVEGFPEATATLNTVRDRLAAHRARPECAGCHDRIDPIGLAFEQFDGVGLWRDDDAGEAIDATGQLPDGTTFDGLTELSALLAHDERFAECAVRKVFTFAHHRAPSASDLPYLARAQATMESSGGSLVDLLVAVATSDTFAAAEAP
jgi:hypothetical protein